MNKNNKNEMLRIYTDTSAVKNLASYINIVEIEDLDELDHMREQFVCEYLERCDHDEE